MATVKHRFGPRDAQYPTTNYATYNAVSGTNFPVESLAFDQTTSETVYFQFPAVNYGSGNLTITIQWYSSATSGGVVWGGSLAAVTPVSDASSIEAKAFATEVNSGSVTVPSTSKALTQSTITLTNLDSIAANDYCILRLARKTADAGDTMAADALVVQVGIDYSDT